MYGKVDQSIINVGYYHGFEGGIRGKSHLGNKNKKVSTWCTKSGGK